jgi:3D (Asp-Asp-Asp) domain-containing protein
MKVRADIKMLGCRKMIGLIIKTLNSIPIVSVKNIVDLKHYLVINYPDLDSSTMQQFVVEFISKTIDSCLGYFSSEYRQPLRQIVLDNARKLNIFEVYASDILKAGLQLGSEFPAFQREIANWVGEFQVDVFAKEAVVKYILNHCQGKAKPDNKPLMPARALAGQPRPNPALDFQTDPHAQTLAFKPDNSQPDPAMEETQSTAMWFNPYVDQESVGSDERKAATERGVADSSGCNLKKYEKLLKLKLRSLAKKRNVCIAAMILLVLLIGCPWVINLKTKMKQSVPVAGKLKVVTEQIARSRSGLNHALSQALNVCKAAPLNPPLQAKDPVMRKVMPVQNAPNTIIVGYVKEKTAAGLVEVPVRRYFERKLRIKASAYDLSPSSCGKDLSHPEYGITRTGTRAKCGRTIAVDPRVIPLGRKVYIVFPKKYSHMNGIYIAEDTGKRIKGYRIDVFWGEDKEGKKQIRKEARAFGHRKVEIYLLQD